MTAPCQDCKVICAASNSDDSCEKCEAAWEEEKSEKKTTVAKRYWELREKQPEGKINMWEEKL